MLGPNERGVYIREGDVNKRFILFQTCRKWAKPKMIGGVCIREGNVNSSIYLILDLMEMG